jgi:hypothetical protein
MWIVKNYNLYLYLEINFNILTKKAFVKISNSILCNRIGSKFVAGAKILKLCQH